MRTEPTVRSPGAMPRAGRITMTAVVREDAMAPNGEQVEQETVSVLLYSDDVTTREQVLTDRKSVV